MTGAAQVGWIAAHRLPVKRQRYYGWPAIHDHDFLGLSPFIRATAEENHAKCVPVYIEENDMTCTCGHRQHFPGECEACPCDITSNPEDEHRGTAGDLYENPLYDGSL